jgi:signal transduction histidine kinase
MSDRVDGAVRWWQDRADAALALVLTGACAVTLAAKGILTSPEAVSVSVSVLGSSALLGWRRFRPVPLAVAPGALVAVPEVTRYAPVINNTIPVDASQFIVVFLYAYSLGTDVPWRWSLMGLVPITAGFSLTAGDFNPLLEMVTVGPWLAGPAVGSRRHAEQRLARRAAELEQERQLFAIQSVQYERTRIARELHDIVAHSVSLMVVQAGAGEHLARLDPARAAEAFESISEAAEQAEAEIDRLLELLDSSVPATPPTGLRIVDELVRRARASGLTISCQFQGDSEDRSELAAQTAYRVVQESVTNAMKHAPGAPIDIMVRDRTDTIEIEIADRPPTAAHSGLDEAIGGDHGLEATGGGHGLAGMRERVARCGGVFHAGPTTDRGWRVTAGLPRPLIVGSRPAPHEAVPWS